MMSDEEPTARPLFDNRGSSIDMGDAEASKITCEGSRSAQQQAAADFQAAESAKADQDNMVKEAQADLATKERVLYDAQSVLSDAGLRVNWWTIVADRWRRAGNQMACAEVLSKPAEYPRQGKEDPWIRKDGILDKDAARFVC